MTQRGVVLWIAVALCLFGLTAPASSASAAMLGSQNNAAAAKAKTFFTCVWQGQTVTIKHITNVAIENQRDAVLAGKCTHFNTNDKYYKKLIGKSINTWVAWAQYPGKFVVHNGLQGKQPVLGAWTFAIGVQAPGMVSGVIRDASTKLPIAGATVTAHYCAKTGTQECVTDTVATDARGGYLIKFYISGSYKVTITDDGYAPSYVATVKAAPGRDVNRNFSLTPSPTPVTLALTANPGTASTTTPVTLTATIGKSVSDGTVTFTGVGPAGAVFTTTTCTPVAGVCSVVWTPTAGGAWSVSAAWSGDARYAPATASTQVTVSGGQTTLMLVASPASPLVNSSTTLTATLGVPTLADGSVTFTASGPAGATATPTACTPQAGACTTTWTPTAAGVWTVTAKWSGDALYSTVSSSTQVTVAPGTATLSIGVNPTSPNSGQQTQLTATLSPAVNDGTVTFTGSGPSGATLTNTTCTPVAGTCTVHWTPSASGAWTITASWSGDASYGATTKNAAVTVTPGVVAFTLSPTSPNLNQQTTLRATLTAAVSDGQVTFTGIGPNGATFTSISCTPTGGTCIQSWTPTVAGVWTITANWSGDSQLAASSATVQVTVGAGSPTISVTQSPNPLPPNTTGTLTATLSVPANDGTITFTGTGPGSAAFTTQSCTPVNGTCSIHWTPSTAGAWAITASWSGDSQYQAISTTVQASVGTTTTLALSTTPTSPEVNHPVTVKATLGQTSISGGTVTFTGTGPNGATFTSTSCTPVNGVCTIVWTPSAAGSWSLSATWNGAGVYAPASQTIQVTVAPPGFLLVSATPNPVAVNQADTLTATLQQAITDGTVTFTISSPSGSSTTKSCAPANGTCSVSFTPNVAGTWSVNGFWSGVTSPNSASDTTQVIVTGLTNTITLTENPPTLVAGGTGSLTATLSPSASDGTVTFTASGPNGVSAATSPSSCTPTNGTCSVSWTPTAQGTWTVTAAWSGDSQYQATSTSIQVTVYNGALQLTSNPPSPTVNTNATVTAVLTQATTGVNDGSITFTFTGPNGATAATTSCTPSSSSCFVTWKPTVVGNWTITGQWSGDGVYAASTNAIVVNVVSASGTGAFVTVTASPNPGKVNQQVNVTVSTAQPENDGVIYVFYQAPDNSGTVQECDQTTNGPCQLPFTPNQTGTWTIQWSWSGDAANGAESGSITLPVTS